MRDGPLPRPKRYINPSHPTSAPLRFVVLGIASMNRREQLRFHADRFLAYVNKSDVDPEKLSAMLALDLEPPLTYPGAVSGFEGVKAIIEKLHRALSQYKLTVLAPVIDEQECRVVFFVKSSGIQTGYILSPRKTNSCTV